jgi:hypothetical protein
MKRSTPHYLQTFPSGFYAYCISYHTGTHHRRRRQSWRTPGLAALALSGLLLLVAAVLHQLGPTKGEDSPVPQAVQQTPVVIVQEDALPPVLHRIAHCESRGQHWTKNGTVLHGKQNPHDIGLFQINTVVWGKKAQELGYDIRTPEGNVHMARYLFENYGSVPWRRSAACWNRTS